MSTRSVISSAELSRQVREGFVGQVFEVILVNSPDLDYDPQLDIDDTFLDKQLAPGTFGYEPQTISFSAEDETSYNDGGVALNTKTAVFINDNQGAYQFTDVVLKRGEGNVSELAALPLGKPSAGITAFVEGLNTATLGAGTGLTIDVQVTDSGVALDDWVATIRLPGANYEVGDEVEVLAVDLIAAGACPPGATGNLRFQISEVNTSDGSIVSVTPTENTVIMQNGNEAVFYFNVKQFGFASQS